MAKSKPFKRRNMKRYYSFVSKWSPILSVHITARSMTITYKSILNCNKSELLSWLSWRDMRTKEALSVPKFITTSAKYFYGSMKVMWKSFRISFPKMKIQARISSLSITARWWENIWGKLSKSNYLIMLEYGSSNISLIRPMQKLY